GLRRAKPAAIDAYADDCGDAAVVAGRFADRLYVLRGAGRAADGADLHVLAGTGPEDRVPAPLGDERVRLVVAGRDEIDVHVEHGRAAEYLPVGFDGRKPEADHHVAGPGHFAGVEPEDGAAGGVCERARRTAATVYDEHGRNERGESGPAGHGLRG